MTPEEQAKLSISWSPSQGVEIHYRSPTKLPEGKIVALDATGQYSQYEWEALAKESGRELVFKTIDLVAPQSKGTWLITNCHVPTYTYLPIYFYFLFCKLLCLNVSSH